MDLGINFGDYGKRAVNAFTWKLYVYIKARVV
jgi:hypothetical protein